MNPETILSRLAKAKEDRRRRESLFDDAIRLTMPGRNRFNSTTDYDSADDIFDETGANATSEFVSRMQAGLNPVFTDFLTLEASSLVDPRDRRSVNRDLEEIQKFAFEEIWASNFAQEDAESLNDMAISTGVLLVEEGRGENAIHNRAVPITELYLERGADDMIGGIFREQKVQAGKLERRYKHADFRAAPSTRVDMAQSSDKLLTVLEYTYRDYSKSFESYVSTVMVVDHKELIQIKRMNGAGANPFIAFRWATVAGETWGRGPLLNAMGAIRTTNLMVEMVLENAAMAIVGIYQTDNDGVINADNISLLPGTILSKEIGSNGLEPVAAATGNFNMQDVVLSDQRMNIKRALYNDMLSDPNKTPATAYEVAERMADLAHRTSAGFARVFYEKTVPYMRRVLYILEKRGDIQLPVKNGRALKFIATSPLAQAQHGRDVQRLMNDFQVRASIYGPQVAATMYDLKELHPWLQDRMALGEKIYKSADDIIKAMQETAAAQAAMMQMQAGPQGGGMAA